MWEKSKPDWKTYLASDCIKADNVREVQTWLEDVPDWKTYLASDCIKAAGQVGGFVSPGSRRNRKVNSKPKPLGPSLLLDDLNENKTQNIN